MTKLSDGTMVVYTGSGAMNLGGESAALQTGARGAVVSREELYTEGGGLFPPQGSKVLAEGLVPVHFEGWLNVLVVPAEALRRMRPSEATEPRLPEWCAHRSWFVASSNISWAVTIYFSDVGLTQPTRVHFDANLLMRINSLLEELAVAAVDWEWRLALERQFLRIFPYPVTVGEGTFQVTRGSGKGVATLSGSGTPEVTRRIATSHQFEDA